MLMRAYPLAEGSLGQSVADAVGWIRRNLQAFYALPMRIGKAALRAKQLEAIATARNRTQEAQQLRDVQASLAQATAQHTIVGDRVKWLLDQLGRLGVQLGVPVIPIAVAAAAAVTAAAIAAVMASVRKQENLIAGIEKGLLTPTEAAALAQASGPAIGISLGPILPVLAIGAGLWFFGPQLARAFRRRGRAA